MSIFEMLYTAIVGPIKLLLNVIYTFSYFLISNPGLSIVVLSLAVNFLVLPLYKQADKIQEDENKKEKELKPGVDHIKKTFKGDERFMILQTYYRQNNYKQTDVLKGLLPLVLEIPFFIAAYDFLSNLSLLNGSSLGIINDLSLPDRIININGITLNLLPIVMTIVNIISSYIYTKDASIKTKIQLLIMALVFLIVLYDSPSGLVLYWTLNNIFSLIKNIIHSNKNSRIYLKIGCSVVGIVIIVYLLSINNSLSINQKLFISVICLSLQLPLVLHYFKRKNNSICILNKCKYSKIHFALSCIFLTILVGLLIPTSVIKSSPSEFVDSNTLVNPLQYVLSCFLLSIGTFVVWLNIFYSLLNSKIQKFLNFIMPVVSIFGGITYFFFGTKLGRLSGRLIYDEYPIFSNTEILLNILVLITILIFIFLMKKNRTILKMILISGIVTLSVISIMNIQFIQPEVKKTQEQYLSASKNISFKLDKKGKNVIVLMLDRAASYYVPYLMEEKPELLDKYKGFVFYPNTISYGANTKEGSAALYGGYDYSIVEFNKRSNVTRMDKQNEALKVMPLLFQENNFNVVVTDPPLANYQTIPDVSIYDDYKNIKAFNTDGAFDYGNEEFYEFGLEILDRNLFCYSICKIVPVCVHNIFYNSGYYNNIDAIVSDSIETNSLSIAHAYDFNEKFIKAYSVLENLSNITEITDLGENNMLLMCNNTTHEVNLLEEPSYEPKLEIDNTRYDEEHEIRKSITGNSLKFETKNQIMTYHINMATLLKLGDYFDYLKSNGVFDNTRIIMVSDHGIDLGLYDSFVAGEGYPAGWFNAFLMEKDFNSNGDFVIDNSFMTNADTPTMAMEDIISNPINPFTGNSINSEYKNGTQYINGDSIGEEYIHNVKTWYTVHDNIFDKNNWAVADNPIK